MNYLVNLRPRVIPNSCVRVVRKLKGGGTLTVAKNQEVSPHDVLGTSLLSPGFSVINIAKQLKISPREVLSVLQKPAGVPIYKGELLAKKKTLFQTKNIIAPTDCLIEKTNPETGELTLKMLPKQLPLLSGVFGIVDEINTLTGEVYIKTMATQITGLFGSGRERGGFLKIVGSPSNLLDSNQITADMKGTIVVSGGLVLGSALKKAMEYQLDGLISGGINFDNYISITGSLYENKKSHTDIGMSVVATEGFGPLTIGDDIFETLKKYEGRYVFINGFESHIVLPETTTEAIVKARKIALPPALGGVRYTADVRTVPLTPGMKVRIIWPPYAASQGKVLSIDGTPTTLASGISTTCALVELSSQKIKVPISNLEAV